MPSTHARQLVLLSALCLSAPAMAQEIATTTGLSFEVASVKASPPAAPNPFGFPVGATIRTLPGGRFTATQATLRDLIRRAYDILDVRISGGPEWIGTARFDVVATAEAGKGTTAQELQRMLRSLLQERFALRAHTETRELAIYQLVTTRRDGALGPRLKTSSIDCASIRNARGPADTLPAGPSEPSCQVSFKVESGSMTIAFQGERSSELARRIIPERDRPMIDNTGLTGTFDGTLTFAPDPPPGFPRLPGSENGVSVFTALQEQWGLKLEPARGPIEILVIDQAERPTEN